MSGTLWFCSALALVVNTRHLHGVTINDINSTSFPFAVRATNYHEALGLATAVMEKIKASRPGYDRWFVSVNDRSEDGVIIDPETLTLT